MTKKEYIALMELLDDMEKVVKLYPAYSLIIVKILNMKYELTKIYAAQQE